MSIILGSEFLVVILEATITKRCPSQLLPPEDNTHKKKSKNEERNEEEKKDKIKTKIVMYDNKLT